ncbi:hypothetical protein [Coleofasciculus sp.]|uniref:hypothetical protein n=1 Tax=Coleofasciculus sp. TaxID=3100458 RepID=UPI0039F8AD5C
MIKHYILSINHNAEYEWEQRILRHPITAERPDFASLIAQAVGDEPGSYLVEVNIEVNLLEKAPNPQPQRNSMDGATKTVNSQPSEWVA